MTDRDPIESLADEFLRRFRAGELPSPEEFADDFLELGDDLPALLHTLAELEQAFPDAARVDETTSDDDFDAAFDETLGKDRERRATAPRRGNRALRQLGDYRLVREVGRGGMGVVYEAEQLSLGRRVALKLLPSHVAHDAGVLERFRREARAAARLHHSNIVPVFEVGRDEDVAYYAMQFIRGRGVDRVIEQLRLLRDREATGPRAAEETGEIGGGDDTSEFETLSSIGPGTDLDPLRVAWDPSTTAVMIPTSPEGVPDRGGPGPSRLALDSRRALRRASGGPSEPGRAGPTAVGSGGSRAREHAKSVARLGRQVAQALAYAHGKGIVHRDIKPSNLILDDDGVVWVADFGLARIDEDRTLTRPGDVLGTLRYMAPECFRQEGDSRADLYALGMTLYELLTLQTAFEESDRFWLIEQIRTSEPRPPRGIDPGIPRDLETIILKAIDKDPETRYATAELLAEDLGRFLDDRPISARKVGPVERFARWCRRKPEQAAQTVAIFGLMLMIAVVSSVMALRLEGKAREAESAAARAERSATLEAAARREVDRSNRLLTVARDDLRRNLYAARVNAALSAWEANDVDRLRLTLEQARPGEDDRDLIGWEWAYLHRLAREERLIFEGHSREVSKLAFCPDSRTLASVQWGGRALLWDTANGAVTREFPGSLNAQITGPLDIGVFGVALSDDGTRIVSQDGERLRPAVRDPMTGEVLAACDGANGSVISLDLSPDGLLLAGGSAQHQLLVWDPRTGSLLHEVGDAHVGAVYDVAFSPDGRTLASAGFDGVVILWDVNRSTITKRARLLGHTDVIWSIAFNLDGSLLASAGWGGKIRLWNVAEASEYVVLDNPEEKVAAVVFSRDGGQLFSAGVDKVVTLWDLHSQAPIRRFRGHTNSVYALAVSPDGRTLASAGADKTVRLWDLQGPSQPRSLTSPARIAALARPVGLAFSPDGGRVVVSAADSSLRGWDTERGDLVFDARVLEFTDPQGDLSPLGLAYSPDGRTLAASTPDFEIVFYDAESHERTATIATGHGHQIRAIAYSPDGTTIASVSDDGRLILHRIDTEEVVFSIVLGSREHERGLFDVAFSPDGETIAQAGLDGVIRLVDSADGRERRTIDSSEARVSAVEYSPDGRTLASCGVDRTIRLWDPATGRLIRSMIGHADTIFDVSFSPDGRRLASAGFDRTIRLWDPSTGLEVLTLKDHDSEVRRVAFSPDGRTLASISDDGTVKLRDALPIDELPDAALPGDE